MHPASEHFLQHTALTLRTVLPSRAVPTLFPIDGTSFLFLTFRIQEHPPPPLTACLVMYVVLQILLVPSLLTLRIRVYQCQPLHGGRDY